jgi:hypothetical protein
VKQVWDRYDYGRDESWYRSVGYPLLKEVAEYWIHELVPDLYFNDGTLVVGPCNSPEMGYIVSSLIDLLALLDSRWQALTSHRHSVAITISRLSGKYLII